MSDTIQDRLRRKDSEKLRLLAHWFDRRDARNDIFNSEVQRDLRRIADEIDRLSAELEAHRDAAPVHLQTMKDMQSEIDRLERELAEKDKRIEELQGAGTKSIVDLQRAEKRIAELEAAKRTYIAPHGYVFTKEQIDAAWKRMLHYERGEKLGAIAEGSIARGFRECLAIFGIVACEKCGGMGVVRSDWGDHMKECDCPNNGWVIEKEVRNEG